MLTDIRYARQQVERTRLQLRAAGWQLDAAGMAARMQADALNRALDALERAEERAARHAALVRQWERGVISADEVLAGEELAPCWIDE